MNKQKLSKEGNARLMDIAREIAAEERKYKQVGKLRARYERLQEQIDDLESEYNELTGGWLD